MEGMELVATVFGLAALCGVNIYLTVFVVGLCLHYNWVALPPTLAPLEVLNDPVLIGLAALFYVLEFAADKVPWVDSLWDFVHTLVRPIGATMLALAVLGDMSPYAQAVAALLCGTLALGTHLAKAGVRVMVNASPEPVSNSVVSLAEDGLVLGGIFLALEHPYILLGLLLAAVVAMVYAAPWCWRQVRALGVFLGSAIWPHRLLGGKKPVKLNGTLPVAPRRQLGEELGGTETVRWVLPVYAGAMRRWRPNEPLWLVRTSGPERLVLIGAKRERIEARGAEDFELGQVSYFLFDEITVFFRGDRRGWAVRVPRSSAAELAVIVRELELDAVAVPPTDAKAVPVS